MSQNMYRFEHKITTFVQHFSKTVVQCLVYWSCEKSLQCIAFNRPFSYCINQARLGAFTAKSGRKHYNPPPLTVMWMNFDSPNFPSLCSLSAIISFQTCSNKCILYVLLFHKCIKIKYKTVNMYGVFLWLVQSSSRWNTIHSHRNYHVQLLRVSGRRILSPGQIAIINTIWEYSIGNKHYKHMTFA